MQEFELKIDFTPDSPKPSRVFSSMGDMIESFDQMDQSFIQSLGFNLSSELLLHDIEKGSLKSILRWILETPDKDALRDGDWKKVIGRAADDARDFFLKKLEENPEIKSTDQLKDMQAGLLQIASTAECPQLISAPTPIPLAKLLGNIKKLEASTRALLEGDEASYQSAYRKRKITKSITISEEVEEELLSTTQIQQPTKAILPVKKPDYIGDSQWELLLGGKVVRANIMDQSWLDGFHSREIKLNPGDALEAILEITMIEDYTGKVVGYKYLISKVINVIEQKQLEQAELPESTEGEQDRI
jgi:hypothetical protein